MKKQIALIIFILFSALVLFLPRQEEKVESSIAANKPLKIAFSQTERDNPWRTEQINSFRNAAQINHMEFIYHEPEEDTVEWQLKDIDTLLQMDIDYLIIAPRQYDCFEEVFQKAKEKQVPVILVESEAKGIPVEDYITYIAKDLEMEGRICAQILQEKYGENPCSIVEIRGDENSFVSQYRGQGFYNEIEKYPNLQIIAYGVGNTDRITAQKAMENIIIDTKEPIQAVFAHSDEDGLGALQALKVAGRNPGKDIDIVSINGVQDVLKAIIAGEYLATVESSPRLGVIAVEAIRRLEAGYSLPPKILVPYRIIDAENARELFDMAY